MKKKSYKIFLLMKGFLKKKMKIKNKKGYKIKKKKNNNKKLILLK